METAPFLIGGPGETGDGNEGIRAGPIFEQRDNFPALE